MSGINFHRERMIIFAKVYAYQSIICCVVRLATFFYNQNHLHLFEYSSVHQVLVMNPGRRTEQVIIHFELESDDPIEGWASGMCDYSGMCERLKILLVKI